MITITPMSFNTNKSNVSFEKSRKDIIRDAPNKELKGITKDLTGGSGDEFALDVGIPNLLKYAEKGKVEKAQAIKILKESIESEELRTYSNRYMFLGIPYGVDGPSDDEGYLGAYEKLTGERLDVKF